jgi:hypothetical protein
MGPVEDFDLAEQHHGYPTTLTLTEFSAQLSEQGFDVSPGDIAPHRMRKESFEGLAVLAPHMRIVPGNGTKFRIPSPIRRPAGDHNRKRAALRPPFFLDRCGET